MRTDDVAQRATVIPVTFDIARLAGQLRNTEIEGGIADAIILATARITSSKIVTGDQHFKDLPNVLYPGEVNPVKKKGQDYSPISFATSQS